MFLKGLFLAVCGGSFGMLASAGVFTALASVGLIPRFAGKMHVADKVFILEEAVVLGTLICGFASIFPDWCSKGLERIRAFCLTNQVFGNATPKVCGGIGSMLLILFGLFAGMFVGCLAFAIAEMLDSIPIFARRIGFRHGLGVAIAAAAFGKLAGSLLYFARAIYLSGV